MRKSIEINALRIPRYHMKLCHNERGDEWQLTEGPQKALMLHTYKKLIDVRRNELLNASSEMPPAMSTVQIFRNHLSSLNSFLSFNGKSSEGTIGHELLSGFDSKLKAYLAALTVSQHTKNDRASHLRAWQRAAKTLMEAKPTEVDLQSSQPTIGSFHETLRAAIASTGESATVIGSGAHTSPDAIHRWLKGAYPNQRTLPSLARLERYLGLERDTLRSLIPPAQSTADQSRLNAARTAIPYRERQLVNSQRRYRVTASALSDRFMKEWYDFFEHKTTTRPRLKRAKRPWRLLPKDKIARELPAYACRHNLGCPTADLNMERFRSFFGYLSLPLSDGGFGLDSHEAQTFAWFAVPEAVDGYLEFMRTRSGGISHGGLNSFAALGTALTNDRTGYLVQRPELAAHLPSSSKIEDWADACARTFELCKDWRRVTTDVSRNPQDPIRGLLNLSEPLGPILRAIAKLDEKAAKAKPGSKAEARCKRGALLLSMLVANPLRARNFILMTWRPDQAGNLYRREDGQWRIRFGAKDFKNEPRALQAQYDAPLPRALAHRIEEYLDEYRPRLVVQNDSVAWVFPNDRAGKWKTLNRQLARITRALIPESHSFGPHAIRHLVATDYLRKHPNDYPTVAQLLHDKLETVLREYAHLRQDDSFGKYEEHLSAIQVH
ncbi:tyrosine-type recombinase/integrase [Caballeronia sp. 15711]|uniref:tyrosine-type recombinase/integrase n=1 Tax=Caballeronia sp. 15711 TaxID=3391029 RepID=UPI0039E2775A